MNDAQLVIETTADKFGEVIWLKRADGNPVCKMVRMSDFSEMAHARLFAAAPVMYGVCKQFEKYARDVIAKWELGDRARIADTLIAQARAVVRAIEYVEGNDER